MRADLILWADVPSLARRYVRPVRIVRAIQKDARAQRWDYVLAGSMTATATVVLAAGLDAAEADPVTRTTSAAGWVATIGICLSLVGRRRWPLQSCAIAIGLLFSLGFTDDSDSIGYVVMLIVLYSVAAALPLRRAMGGIAMLLGLVAASRVAFDAAPAAGLVGAGVAFTLGRLVRRRREHQVDQAADAQRRATDEIEIAEIAAAVDRQRLAQEVHDVVAHSLSVIAVQAGIGAHLIHREPIEATRALDAIRATCDSAGNELTRLIDILRDGDRSPNSEPASLADVSALCAQLASAGVPIDLVVDGDLASVPAGASLAAYRIVQEALTNVVRHAGPASVTVTVTASADLVELSVVDDGRGVASPTEPERLGTGHGLVGMVERARLYGGDATAGPRPGGGFAVSATVRYFSDAADVDDTDRPVPARIDHAVDARRPTVPVIAWDLGLAFLLVGFAIWELLAARAIEPSAAFRPTDVWAWVLTIGCCLTLVARRRLPVLALVASAVFGSASTMADYRSGNVVLVVLGVGLYTVGSSSSTKRFVALLAGISVVMSLVAWSDPPDLDTAGAIWTAMLAAGAAIAGFAVRLDRDRGEAKIVEHTDAGRAASRRAGLAVATERLLIADELNSVVTTSIDSIEADAHSAAVVIDRDPDAALVLLEAISATSRSALADLRRVLKRMRIDGEAAPHAPVQPTWDTSTPGGAR